MRHLFVDKASADIRILAIIVSLIIWEECRCQSFLCNVQSNTTGVYGNPSASPLLSNIGCCSATTSRIKNQITWVCCHENTSLNYFFRSLYYIFYIHRCSCVLPNIINGLHWEIIVISNIIRHRWWYNQTIFLFQLFYSSFIGFPTSSFTWIYFTIYFNVEHTWWSITWGCKITCVKNSCIRWYFCYIILLFLCHFPPCSIRKI